MLNLQEQLSLMVRAAQAGGNQALAKRGRSPVVSDTGGGSLTTAEDEAVQATVMRFLREGEPGVNIIGEEDPDKRMTDQAYIIDPIDGSVNYARDGREWCCTVAYKDGDDIDAGVIYQPRTGILVTANRGVKLSLREGGVEQEIPPAPTGPVDLRKLVIHSPLSGEFSDEIIHEVFAPLMANVRFTSMSGSNTNGIIQLVLGIVDGLIGWGSLWDFAAGKLFVEMTGGACATFHGDPIDVAVIAPQRVVFARSQAALDAILPFTRKWSIERERRRR